MIIKNLRDEPFYLEDLVNLLIERDKNLFTQEQYKNIKENLVYLIEDINIPKEDSYMIVSQILNFIQKLNDTNYKHYSNINLHNGNNISKQRNRDIEKINNFENFLLKLYKDYVLYENGRAKYFKNPPNNLVEQFKFLEELKENISKEGTLEYNLYNKPKRNTKEELKQLFKEIETHYKRNLNEKNLEKFIKNL